MSDSTVDQVMPEGGWKFDAEVTAAFDNMLERSIPQYEVMRRACFELACKYAQRRTAIIDLGCSRGEAIAMLVDRFGINNRFIGIDVSEPMLAAARERFKGLINVGVVDVRSMDLRFAYPQEKASVTLAVLCLQFTPIEYRMQIIRRIWEHTVPGGALILVEKVLGASAAIDDAMVERYLSLKKEHGYTQDQIDRKKFSLEGVLVPVTAKWNEELMRSAGFEQVDCFWRWMNFAGWIALAE